MKHYVKGTRTIDEFIQQIKINVDALALLGSPVDQEYLTNIVLDGFSDDNKQVIDLVNGRDVPILIVKLHEKLLNREIEISNCQS